MQSSPDHAAPFAERLSDGLVLLLFLAVPLAASPRFWDQFTTVKWYVLEVLAAFWFVAELLGHRRCAWPAFLTRRPAISVGIAGLIVVNSLRGGFADAAAPLLERATFVMLALCSFWYFVRTGGRTRFLMAGTALATIAVDAAGLAQVFGFKPLKYLTAGQPQASFFGNVNITAQFLGFAVLILLTVPSAGRSSLSFPSEDPRRRGFHPGAWLPSEPRTLSPLLEAGRWILIAASLAYLFFLSCRSVLLALLCAAVVHLGARRTRFRWGFLLATTAGLAALLLSIGPVPAAVQELRVDKWTSLHERLGVGWATLEMTWDHPLGVGSGNFGEAFIPYRSRVGSAPDEALVYLHPHNEYLRILAEEGVLVFLLGTSLLVSLLRELRRRGEDERRSPAWLLPTAVFLAVEGFFQFPLALAFGALMAATLLGGALASVEPVAGVEDGGVSWRHARVVGAAAGLALAVLALAEVARAAGSEYLFVSCRDDVWCQDRACRLNSRNRAACVQSAWLHARSGDSRGARERLLRLLDRAPYFRPAIKLLGEEALVRGDRATGCLCLWIYDGLLRQRSSVHDRLRSTCEPRMLASFAARIKMPVYGAFPLSRESPR